VELDPEQRLHLRRGAGGLQEDAVGVGLDAEARRLEPLLDAGVGRHRLTEALAEPGRREPLVEEPGSRILLGHEQRAKPLEIALAE
jgi:hypothetical protein